MDTKSTLTGDRQCDLFPPAVSLVAQWRVLWFIYSFDILKLENWWAMHLEEAIDILKYNEKYSLGENL